jgi:phosphonate degradation associated HDIG domain protein
MTTSAPDPVSTLRALFDAWGDRSYGEDVTQRGHMLQSAALAEAAGAPDSLVVAALLHDVGHFVYPGPEDIAALGVDAQHEDAGADWLAQWFGPEVVEPVRLHVAAKRWRCGRQPAYLQTLSAASVQSLALQGGPMSEAEAIAFEASPWFEAAVQLRDCDDRAKELDAETPDLEHFLQIVRRVTSAAAPQH